MIRASEPPIRWRRCWVDSSRADCFTEASKLYSPYGTKNTIRIEKVKGAHECPDPCCTCVIALERGGTCSFIICGAYNDQTSGVDEERHITHHGE
jgi:hypothetical protein